MASQREIRRKIKSVKSTQQITKAMKMVAAARMRKAQNAILSSRPFAVKLDEAIRDLALMEAEQGEAKRHPYFEPREDARPALVLVSADRGLCGSFNASVLRSAAQWLRARSDRKVSLYIVGRKARDFIRRLAEPNLEMSEEMVGIFPKVGFKHAEILAKPLLERYEAGELSSVTVLYNEFKSAMVQRVVTPRLLPIEPPAPRSAGVSPAAEPPAAAAETLNPYGFRFEPGRDQLLDVLLKRNIKAQLYRHLLESQAAELAARMNAMEAATSNASDMIDHLTLELNRTRQAVITKEIAELVGGAEALAA